MQGHRWLDSFFTRLLNANTRMQNENFSESVQKVRENTDKINTFWKNKRNSQEMDAVYSQLLRSGSSSVKRHYELTGKLSDTEATQNPEYARMQRLLALPPTDAEKEANAAAKGPSNASSPPAKPQRA